MEYEVIDLPPSLIGATNVMLILFMLRALIVTFCGAAGTDAATIDCG
jgi:hypothetical protein